MASYKYVNRNVDSEFLAWKGEKRRKVLLLRGARQVGKSSSMRKLGEKFEYFLEVNFEKDRRAHTLFERKKSGIRRPCVVRELFGV